jgi:peptidoglycan/LPS O-acetylase OafA/YrhL
LLVASETLLALLAAWVMFRRATESRVSAGFVSGSAVLAALAALHAIDKSSLSNGAYGLVPALGVVALLAAGVADGLVRHWVERSRRVD